MLAATLLAVAASLPLGVWPSETGPAATTVHDVEFYVADPEDDYTILAVQPLAAPLKKAEPAELRRLAALAEKLGADGVLLLGEMPERSVPEDYDAPLPTTGRYSVAVFVSFDGVDEWEGKLAVPSIAHRVRSRSRVLMNGHRHRDRLVTALHDGP
ncbi:MAG: hypothetical protein A2Y78_14860 [Acidobacteria bacterium RBG_13_68_16]|jgi:hypothetical protein|nr:MAG: hypothetical protein A2Y78_14860 [Acidobacteria bacterium RBG_13_68_16]